MNAVASPSRRRGFVADGWCFAVLMTLAAAFIVWCDASARVALLRAATETRTSPRPATALRVPLHDTLLTAAALDGKWWIIHTEEMVRRGAWRIHDTDLDNAPHGRPVHWSSALPLAIAGTATVRSWLFGGKVIEQVAEAALWIGPITWLACAGLIALLAGGRFGGWASGVAILSSAACLPIAEAFRVGDPDHHGLILTACFACVFCLVAGGAGLGREASAAADAVPGGPQARRWLAASGVFGAVGLWISAASTLPLLAGCIAGGAAAMWLGKGAKDVSLRPAAWRLWSGVGAAASIALYLWEYFPGGSGFRLEVNHPLYALAWLGAGELLFRLGRRMAGGVFTRGWREGLVLAAGAGAAVLPAILIATRGTTVFALADPLVRAILTDGVQELRPFTAVARENAPFARGAILWPAFSLTLLVLLHRAQRVTCAWRAVLALAAGPALVLQIQAVAQVRWAGLAQVCWLALLVVLIAIWRSQTIAPPLPRGGKMTLAVIAVAASSAWPAQCVPAFFARHSSAQRLPQNLVPSILLRDIAHRLAERSPAPLILSDPSSSTELAYFGHLRTLGTLYWENAAGLRRAAEIFAAPDETEARRRLTESGVTHLVLASWDAYSSPAAFAARLSPPTDRPPSSFLESVSRGVARPDWLRPYAYPIPEAFGMPHERVCIFEVRTPNSTAEALLHWAVFDAESGDLRRARATLLEAQKHAPTDPQIAQWLREIDATFSRPPAPAPSR